MKLTLVKKQAVFFWTKIPSLNCTWRTLAYQEVILRIGPLAKLGRFESTAETFFVYIATISFTKVLHELYLSVK